MTHTDEGTQAQHWRQVVMGLSIKELAELTGYSVTAIRCFEANANTRGELFGPDAWKRYRMACRAVVLTDENKPAIATWPMGDPDARTQR